MRGLTRTVRARPARCGSDPACADPPQGGGARVGGVGPRRSGARPRRVRPVLDSRGRARAVVQQGARRQSRSSPSVLGSSTWAGWPCTPRPSPGITARAGTVPTRLSDRRAGGGELPARCQRSHRCRTGPPSGDPPGLRLPGGERRLRPRTGRPVSPGSARRPRRSRPWARRWAHGQRMQAAGVPIVPGTTEEIATPRLSHRLGDRYGWPMAIKAGASRRWPGPWRSSPRPRAAGRALEAAREGARPTSQTRRCTSRSTSTIRATSRSRSWPMATADGAPRRARLHAPAQP